MWMQAQLRSDDFFQRNKTRFSSLSFWTTRLGLRTVFDLSLDFFKFLTFSVSVSLQICLSVYWSICLLVYLSIGLSVHLSICLSVYCSICLLLLVYLSIGLSVYWSICLLVYLSVQLYVLLCHLFLSWISNVYLQRYLYPFFYFPSFTSAQRYFFTLKYYYFLF